MTTDPLLEYVARALARHDMVNLVGLEPHQELPEPDHEFWAVWRATARVAIRAVREADGTRTMALGPDLSDWDSAEDSVHDEHGMEPVDEAPHRCPFCSTETVYQTFSGGKEWYCPGCDASDSYESGQAPRRVAMLTTPEGRTALRKEMREHLAPEDPAPVDAVPPNPCTATFPAVNLRGEEIGMIRCALVAGHYDRSVIPGAEDPGGWHEGSGVRVRSVVWSDDARGAVPHDGRSYEEKISAPMSPASIQALAKKLADGTVARRKIKMPKEPE
jgi:ribosomal protein L37AE/L43A